MFWLFELYVLYDSVLKLAPEILPVRFTQRISDMGRNFNIIPIEIGESLNDAFLCSMIKAIGLLLWRFRFRPIAINRIQPAFFVGKHHVEWDDLLALTELDFAWFARPGFLWQEHQNKLIFIMMDFSECLPCMITWFYSTATVSFRPIRVFISSPFLSSCILFDIVLCKGGAASFLWFLLKEIKVGGENGLTCSHSNRVFTYVVMSIPATNTSYVITVNGHQNTSIPSTWIVRSRVVSYTPLVSRSR